MSFPLISILIPAYNAEKYLSETIQSAINQTYTDIEVIIVDDGSTDKTFEVAKSFQSDKIKVFSIQNSGQSAASNYAFQQSNGEYVKFLDADDILNPEHIQLQFNSLENTTNQLSNCEWGRFYAENYKETVFEQQVVWQNMPSLEWLKTNLLQTHDMLSGWQWLIPRNLFEKCGGWEERLSLNNDFDFSIRLILASSQIGFAQGAKYYYRSGLQNSLSVSISRKAAASALLTTQLGCENLLKIENSKEIQQFCANRYQIWLYRIYPLYPDILKEFEDGVKKHGGSTVSIEGGKILKSLTKLTGWKSAKKIQTLFYALGWKYIAMLKMKFLR